VWVREVCDKYDLPTHRLIPGAVRQDVAHYRQTVACRSSTCATPRRRSGDPQRAEFADWNRFAGTDQKQAPPWLKTAIAAVREWRRVFDRHAAARLPPLERRGSRPRHRAARNSCTPNISAHSRASRFGLRSAAVRALWFWRVRARLGIMAARSPQCTSGVGTSASGRRRAQAGKSMALPGMVTYV